MRIEKDEGFAGFDVEECGVGERDRLTATGFAEHVDAIVALALGEVDGAEVGVGEGGIAQFSIARRFVSPKFFSLGRSLNSISSARTDFLVWKFSVGIAMLNIKIDRHMLSL